MWLFCPFVVVFLYRISIFEMQRSSLNLANVVRSEPPFQPSSQAIRRS